MRKGRNNGKKLMAVRIVKHTLEIIHLLTDQNPVQVSLLPHFLYLIISQARGGKLEKLRGVAEEGGKGGPGG
jgi:hypothetical protein